MAIYYINKITGNNTRSAAEAQNPETPWKDFTAACDAAKTGVGNHTIEVMANTGPYYTTDCRFLNQGFIFPNHPLGTTTTWNFNGNSLQLDVDVNNGAYTWHKSNAVGKTDWFYLTATDGTAPTVTKFDSTQMPLPQVKTCVVNGWWSCESTNLVANWNECGERAANNWGWGDFDSIGFNTLYVRYAGGIDPTGGNPILAGWFSIVFRLINTYGNHNINDAVFSGALTCIQCETVANINRCTFYNADQHAVSVTNVNASGTTVKYCKMLDAGHRGVYVSGQANVTVENNHFENVHLMLLLSSDTAYTVTARNNSSKNLLAGAIQHDKASPTLIEDHNQFHLDPTSPHGDNTLAFTTASTRWTMTDISDIPSGVLTSNGCTPDCGTDPIVDRNGVPYQDSPLINAGTLAGELGVQQSKDLTQVLRHLAPYDRLNIGPYQVFSDSDLRRKNAGLILRGKM